MNFSQADKRAALAITLIAITLFSTVIIGWLLNLTKLAGATSFGVEEVVRVLGAFLIPLGAIMGYLVP